MSCQTPNGELLAFVHIPKTAGTTHLAILRRNFGVRHYDRTRFVRDFQPDDLRRIQLIFRNLNSIGGHPVKPFTNLESAVSSIRYYAFFREPVSQSISYYLYRLREQSSSKNLIQDFESDWQEWIHNHQNIQCSFLCGKGDAKSAIPALDRIGFVGLQSHYDESLVLWKHWTGIDNLDIRYNALNKASQSEPIRTDLPEDYQQRIRDFGTLLRNDSEKQEIIHRCNREDLKLFPIAKARYEAQRQEYAGDLAADLQQFRESNQDVDLPNDNTLGWLLRVPVMKLLRSVILRP